MCDQASRALWRSIRLVVCCNGGRGGIQVKVRSSTIGRGASGHRNATGSAAVAPRCRASPHHRASPVACDNCAPYWAWLTTSHSDHNDGHRYESDLIHAARSSAAIPASIRAWLNFCSKSRSRVRHQFNISPLVVDGEPKSTNPFPADCHFEDLRVGLLLHL